MHINEVKRHIHWLLLGFLLVVFLTVILNLGFPGPHPQHFATFMPCTQHLILSHTEREYKLIKPIIKALRFIKLKTLYGILIFKTTAVIKISCHQDKLPWCNREDDSLETQAFKTEIQTFSRHFPTGYSATRSS